MQRATQRAARAAEWHNAVTMALYEPRYQIEQRLGRVELRRYAPYAVAQVEVAGDAGQAGREAFGILAGYIFGRNRGARALDMTAPVTQAATAARLPMTAPVTQAACAGGYVVQFVLPDGLRAADAPEPLDPRVQLRDVAAGLVAVLRYSGRWTQANYRSHLDELQATLRQAQRGWHGEPTLARYNPPYTPWLLRRNEVWLRLDEPRPHRPPR